LLIQSEKLLENAIVSCLEEEIDFFGNNDLNIVFSYLAQKIGVLFLMLPAKITYPFENMSRKESYERIHFELYSEHGEIHQTPLEVVRGNGFTIESISSVNDLYKVRASLQMILKSVLNVEESEYTVGFGDELRKIIDLVERVCHDISLFLRESVVQSTIRKEEISSDIMYNLKEVSTSLQNRHNALFVSNKESENVSGVLLRDKIRSIVDQNTQVHLLKIDNVTRGKIVLDGSEDDTAATKPKGVWYYWNADIEQELKFLLSNVRHCPGDMLESKHEGKAHMLVYAKIGTENCEITITNVSLHNSHHVKSNINKKARNSQIRNKELGVKMSASSIPTEGDASKYKLTLKLEIPAVKLSLLEGEICEQT
jgi:hypothetical protein